MAATLIAASTAPVLANPTQFSDVSPSNWAYQAILSLRDKYGCAKGYPDGTFRAGATVTRAQLAALTNACLDSITAFVDQKDAALASALRTEVNRLDNRIVKLEVANQAKSLRVGSYLGAGISATRRPDDGFNNNNSDTAVGGTIQGRFPLFKSGAVNAVSLRPFLTFSSDNTSVRTLGGATVTYDLSVARSTLLDGTQVSKANIYAGVGGIFTSRGGFGGTDTEPGSSGTGVGVIGYEMSLSPSLVAFTDVKLPFQSTRDFGDLRNGKSTYSPIGTIGLGFKF